MTTNNNNNNSIVYFYSHKANKCPYKAYCFSNFFESNFVDDEGMNFMCNEQYIMYHKAKLMKDDETAQKILEAKTPADCKLLGRQVKNYDDAVWSEARLAVCIRGLTYKFTQNEVCKHALLSTKQMDLAEASKSDAIWGIGLTAAEAKKVGKAGWKGENLLGRALVEVRNKLVLAQIPEQHEETKA